MPRILIIDKGYGRLGNTLYRLCNLIAFSVDNNCIVLDFSMTINRYSKYFPNICSRLFLTFPHSLNLPFSALFIHKLQLMIFRFIRTLYSFTIYRKDNSEVYLKGVLSDTNSNFIILRHFHFTADDSVRRHADLLRKLFTPSKIILKKVQDKFNELSQFYDYFIAVHIRHGDYKAFRNGLYFYDENHYAQIMKKTEKLIPNKKVLFLIFSDSNGLNLSSFSDMNFYIPNTEKSLMFDWYMMSLCNLIIATNNTTYSGWASFYGEVPIFRLSKNNYPRSLSDFHFDAILNNSDEYIHSSTILR
ncbi:MAG: hypothetical protein ACRENO_00560 [Thermodesulfobacteriota bacterium]